MTDAEDLSLFPAGIAAELMKDNEEPVVAGELGNYSLKVTTSDGIERESGSLVIDFPS